MSLYLLRQFYAHEEVHGWSRLSRREDVTNGTQRRLSTLSDDELLKLMDGARELVTLAQAEYQSRAFDEMAGAEYERAHNWQLDY